MKIIREITEKVILELERSKDVLLLIGPRRSGKTTILKQVQSHLASSNNIFIDLEDVDYLTALNESPKNLLKFISSEDKVKSYVFIDEIQYLDNPTNFLKYIHDTYKEKIQLVVSGSSAFYIDRKFKDSLVGRKKIYEVRTLSFKEFLRFRSAEELYNLDLTKLSLLQEREISNLYHEYMLWGGYPAVVLEPNTENKKLILREYAYSYIKKDLYEAGVRDEQNFYRLLKILANQTGDLVNSSELASTLGVSQPSIENYLYLLQKSFHISLIRPFYSNPRKELTKMPKVYFGDIGLRNFFIANFDPWLSRSDKGQILENMVFKRFIELKFIDQINFWRSNEDNEVDFVIDAKQAYEVKSSLKSFRANKYKKFIEAYPKLSLDLISVDLDPEFSKKLKHKCHNIWEL